MRTVTHSSRRDQLDEQGYVVVNDVLDQEHDLQPILDDYARRLDLLATSLHASGKISETYPDLEFGPRLIRITRDYGKSLSQYFDISLPQAGIRSDTPLHLTESCFRLLTNKRLLDLAEELIGPEILVSPVGHVRIKLPEGTLEQGDGQMAKIPWHQDNGVVLDEADQSNVLTVWLAINDATVENGCMQVLPCHRRTDLIPHCPSTSKGAHIPDRQVDEGRARQLPMKAGSVLLMHPRTVHSSLGNSTVDQVRISMDLRYQPVGEPTGRPMFPAFVGRSRSDPDLELRDSRQWSQMWLAARARLAEDQPAAFNRWDADSPACA
jgi:phytanoyl-CoA hydroxylase